MIGYGSTDGGDCNIPLFFLKHGDSYYFYFTVGYVKVSFIDYAFESTRNITIMSTMIEL